MIEKTPCRLNEIAERGFETLGSVGLVIRHHVHHAKALGRDQPRLTRIRRNSKPIPSAGREAAPLSLFAFDAERAICAYDERVALNSHIWISVQTLPDPTNCDRKMVAFVHGLPSRISSIRALCQRRV